MSHPERSMNSIQRHIFERVQSQPRIRALRLAVYRSAGELESSGHNEKAAAAARYEAAIEAYTIAIESALDIAKLEELR